jgi:hypothetical protein
MGYDRAKSQPFVAIVSRIATNVAVSRSVSVCQSVPAGIGRDVRQVVVGTAVGRAARLDAGAHDLSEAEIVTADRQ